MEDFQIDPRLIHMLLARLERTSADSYWAHRASGVRGSLIKLVEQMDAGISIPPQDSVELIKMGFSILEQAAREKRGI